MVSILPKIKIIDLFLVTAHSVYFQVFERNHESIAYELSLAIILVIYRGGSNPPEINYNRDVVLHPRNGQWVGNCGHDSRFAFDFIGGFDSAFYPSTVEG